MIKPLIVAELGASHLGSFERAHKILSAAAKAGADAFKVQVWSPDTMCIDPTYVIGEGAWKGRGMMDLYRECFTPWEWLPELFDAAYTRDLIPFASVFDEASVDYMERLNVEMYKIASYELVDLNLLRRIAATGKRAVLSTGAATLDEISAAVAQFENDQDVTLLHCVSEYPSKPEQANLATMLDLAHLGCDFGLSDHSMGAGVAVAAAAIGASVIEKHLTLRRADGGPDAGFSMEPEEFALMCDAVRQAAVAVGNVQYIKKPTRLRRSLWIAQDAPAGEVITPAHIRTARPALGVDCALREQLPGKRFLVDVKAGMPLTAAIFGD